MMCFSLFLFLKVFISHLFYVISFTNEVKSQKVNTNEIEISINPKEFVISKSSSSFIINFSIFSNSINSNSNIIIKDSPYCSLKEFNVTNYSTIYNNKYKISKTSEIMGKCIFNYNSYFFQMSSFNKILTEFTLNFNYQKDNDNHKEYEFSEKINFYFIQIIDYYPKIMSPYSNENLFIALSNNFEENQVTFFHSQKRLKFEKIENEKGIYLIKEINDVYRDDNYYIIDIEISIGNSRGREILNINIINDISKYFSNIYFLNSNSIIIQKNKNIENNNYIYNELFKYIKKCELYFDKYNYNIKGDIYKNVYVINSIINQFKNEENLLCILEYKNNIENIFKDSINNNILKINLKSDYFIIPMIINNNDIELNNNKIENKNKIIDSKFIVNDELIIKNEKNRIYFYKNDQIVNLNIILNYYSIKLCDINYCSFITQNNNIDDNNAYISLLFTPKGKITVNFYTKNKNESIPSISKIFYIKNNTFYNNNSGKILNEIEFNKYKNSFIDSYIRNNINKKIHIKLISYDIKNNQLVFVHNFNKKFIDVIKKDENLKIVLYCNINNIYKKEAAFNKEGMLFCQYNLDIFESCKNIMLYFDLYYFDYKYYKNITNQTINLCEELEIEKNKLVENTYIANNNTPIKENTISDITFTISDYWPKIYFYNNSTLSYDYSYNNNYIIFKIEKSKEKNITYEKWSLIINKENNICSPYYRDNIFKCNIDNLNNEQIKKLLNLSNYKNSKNILPLRNIKLHEVISDKVYNFNIKQIPYNFFNIKLIVENNSFVFYFEGYYLLNETDLFCTIQENKINLFSKIINNSCIFNNIIQEKIYTNKKISLKVSYKISYIGNITYTLHEFIINKSNIIFEDIYNYENNNKKNEKSNSLNNIFVNDNILFISKNNIIIINGYFYSNYNQIIYKLSRGNDTFYENKCNKINNYTIICNYIPDNNINLYFYLKVYLFFDKEKLNKSLFLFIPKTFFKFYSPKISDCNLITSNYSSYIILYPNKGAIIRQNLSEIQIYLNIYIYDNDSKEIINNKRCVINNYKNIILCKATKKDINSIIENNEIIFNINNIAIYKYNNISKNRTDFIKGIESIKDIYNLNNDKNNIDLNKRVKYKKKTYDYIFNIIEEIVEKDKKKLLKSFIDKNPLVNLNEELLYNGKSFVYNFYYLKKFIKIFPKNLNNDIKRQYEINKIFNFTFEVSYLSFSTYKDFNTKENLRQINNSFVCTMIEFNTQKIKYIAKAVFNNNTNYFICPNLYCISKGEYEIEVAFFYLEKYEQILLKYKFNCVEYINDNSTNYTNLLSSRFFNALEKNDSMNDKKIINDLSNYISNSTSIIPAFKRIIEKIKTKNDLSISYEKIKYEWESNHINLNDSDYNLALNDDDNIYININKKKIIEIDNNIIPNIYYSSNHLKKLKIKISGDALSKKELIFIKFISSEDNTKYQLTICNITDIESKHHLIDTECNLPINNIFLKNNVYIQVSQNHFKFEDLNKENEYSVKFVDNIFIVDAEPKLINFEGIEKINIRIKENDAFSQGLIDKSKLVCMFKLGLSTMVTTELNNIEGSDTKFYCESADFSKIIKNIKNYFVELTIQSSENNLIESNTIEIKMYYNYYNNKKYFDIYPQFLSFSTNNNIISNKGFFIKIKELNDVENKNNFLSNVFYDLYCNLRYKNELNIILDENNAVIHNNSTIYCDLEKMYQDYNLFNDIENKFGNEIILPLNIHFSVNKGNKFEQTFKNLYLYLVPTFENSINIESLLNNNNQNEKYFLLEIKGNNFINTYEYLDSDEKEEEEEIVNQYCIFEYDNDNNIRIFSELIYIDKNTIKCKFNFNNIHNKYKIYITYNNGEELIDTGLTFMYDSRYYIKTIYPSLDIYNYNPYDNSNNKQYTNINIFKDIQLSEILNINNNEYNCIFKGIYEEDIKLELNNNLNCIYPLNYDIFNKYINNYTPFKYTNVEIIKNTFLYSDSNITFFLLDIIIDEVTPLLGPFNEIIKVSIKGKNFINTFKIKLLLKKDGNSENIEINHIKYINSTSLEFDIQPLVQDLDNNNYYLLYSINDAFYYPMKNNLNNQEFIFKFYPEISITDISPHEIFENEREVLIISGSNIIDNELLTCKVGEFYTTHCEYISEHSCKCEIPEYTYLVNGEQYNINSNNNYLRVGLSNNGQNYIYYEYLYFKAYIFLDTILNLKYYPKYGPEEGGSKIHIELGKDFNKYLNKNNIDSKCLFGNYIFKSQIIYKDDDTSPYIDCISPNLNSIEEKYVENFFSNDLHEIYLKYSKINITIIIEDLNFALNLTFIYNTNVTINDYMPNNVDYEIKDNAINLEVYTNSIFYFLSDNIKCKFSFPQNNNEIIITNAKYINFQIFSCQIPKMASMTSPTYAYFSFSLNGEDFYEKDINNENLIIYYRPNEKIKTNGINMTYIPILSNSTYDLHRKVEISLDYFFNGDYKQSYCVITDNEYLSSSNFIIYTKTDNSEKYNSNDNKISCLIPNDIYLIYKNNHLLPETNHIFFIGVSSNKKEYIQPLTQITLYIRPTIKSCNKNFFSIYDLFNIELIVDNIIKVNDDSLKVILSCNSIEHIYSSNDIEFITDNTLNKIYSLKIKNINLNNCLANQLVDIKLTYDEINYSFLNQNKYTFKINSIKSVFPSLIIKEKTKQILVEFNEKIIDGNQNYKCKFIYNNYIIISDTYLYGDKALICTKINNLLKDINVDSNEIISIELIILINEEDKYVTNSVNINMIKNFQINSVSNDIYNYLSVKNIEYNLDSYHNSIDYFLKIGDSFIFPLDKQSTSNNNIIFTIKEYFIENTDASSVFLSINIDDWYSTSTQIFYNKDILCLDGRKCIDFYSTIYSNEINDNSCPEGYFCLNGISMKCKAGYYNDGKDLSSCKECPQGKICNKLNLINPISCPKGFICKNKKISSINLLSPCHEGYYCTKNENEEEVECPEGKYCPIATSFKENDFNKHYNIFGYPQQCKSGYICQKTHYSINQFGNSICTQGNFCQKGLKINCENNLNEIFSFECTQEVQIVPNPCISGTYRLLNNIINSCILCPLGSICSEVGTFKPQYCPPGRICEFSGLYRPSDYCPGGYYCIDSIIGFPTKNPKGENSLEYFYYPQICDRGQLCLLGITNPITNEFDPQSPQPCLPGMVCDEGSSGTSTLDQCPKGFFCPGYDEPQPAQPGYYVPGTGFVSPLKCAPGYYTDEYNSTFCKLCEKGTYNYLQAQTKCSLCEPGSYCEEDSDHIICTLCPEGTYNPKSGSYTKDDCIPCPKGYLCDLEGMYDFETQSKVCPSGFICTGGTNNNNIQLCPPGFYCEQGTGDPYQFHICLEGYYCEKGSTSNNNKKNPCLEGWYCPYGTYYDYDNAKLKISSDLNKLIEEKKKYSPNDPEISMVANAQCFENLILDNSIINHFLNENNLKCPEGTTSKEGAICLGQCIKGKIPYILIDPLDEEDYNLEDENDQNRRLEDGDEIEENTNLDEKHLIIRPYEIIYIIFNFKNVPSYMIFNIHYSILIKINGKEIEMESYIEKSIETNVISGNEVCLRVFNYNQEKKNLNVYVELNNQIYSSQSSTLKNTGKIIRVIPSRAELFTNKIFPFIIFQNTFINTKTVSSNFKINAKTISLPFNFAIPNQDTNLISITNLNIDKKNVPENYQFYEHGFYSNDPYSPSLFENNNLKYIFMPYFPYISNCYGYDKYLYFFDILQNDSYCNLINYENTKIVTRNPFKRIYPFTDSCEINLVCKYDEIEQNVIANRWFSLEEKATLAYTTKEPIDIEKTFGNKFFGDQFDLDDLDKIAGIIPINFVPHRNKNYNDNCFPNRIEINIKYYHENKAKKKIYEIEVNMYDYINCKESSSSIETISNDEYKNPSNIISNSTQYNGVYTLKINFSPMNYFSLLDYYQFSYIFYFVLIFLLSLLFFSFIIIILFMLKRNRNRKISKFLTFKKQIVFIEYFYYPFIEGIFYGILLLTTLISIITFNEKMNIFYSYSSTWEYLDSGGFESEIENKYYSNARVSLYFLFCSIYLFILATNRLVPMPDEKYLIQSNKEKLLDELNNMNEDKNKEQAVISKKSKKLKKIEEENDEIDFYKKKEISSSSDDEHSENNNEDKKKFYDDEEVKITIVISWKKRMALIKYLFCLALIIIKNFYFNLNGTIYVKAFFIIIIDILIEEFFLKIIFKEALLAAPLLVINRIMKFITLIEIGGFTSTIIIYFISTIIDSVMVVFIIPVLDKIEFLLFTKIHLFRLKHMNKLMYKLMHKIVIINNFLYNEEKWKEEYEKQVYKYLNKKDELSLEPILRINYLFSIKLMAVLFNPITVFIFYHFSEETKIKELFSLKEEGLYIHYFLLSLSIIIPEMILQLILINIIQIYYNININDYLEFCHFRYSIRETDFINMRYTMEYGINKFWRSLDALLFSEQYYLNLFISTSFLLLFIIGIIILTFYSYNPLGEPYLIFIIFVFLICIIIFHNVIKLLNKFILKIFEPKNPPINKRTGKFLQFLEMDNTKNNKSTTSKKFRSKFVKVNKIWIIENLTKALGIEDDINNDLDEKGKGQLNKKKELELKLQQIYQDALDYEFIEKEMQQKKELIKRDLEIMPYNQENVGEINKDYGIRLDISKDSNSDISGIYFDGKIKKLDKFFEKDENIDLKKRIIDIAQIWKNKAKEILIFKKWSVDVIRKKKKSKCQKCSSDFNLQVYQNIPFEELIEDFKKRNIGEVPGIIKWQKYFEANQKFVTLCVECAYIRNTQMVINKALSSDKNKETKKKIENKILTERLKKYYIKGIALNWLYHARSKILIRKIDRELKDEDIKKNEK